MISNLSIRSGSNKTCLLTDTSRCFTLPHSTEIRGSRETGVQLFCALDSSQAATAVLLKLSLQHRVNSVTYFLTYLTLHKLTYLF